MTLDSLSEQLAMADQLLQQGQALEAQRLLKKLHKTHPKHADVMLYLGFAERRLQHWPEAIAILKKATEIAPNNVLYKEHLAMALMYSNIGHNMMQAIATYAQVLTLRPDFYPDAANLMVLGLRCNAVSTILQAIAPLLGQPSLTPNERLHYAAACAIAAYVTNDIEACLRYIDIAASMRSAAFDSEGKPVPSDIYYLLLYTEFLHEILAYRRANRSWYEAQETITKTIHAIGESHSLTPAQLLVRAHEGKARIIPHIMTGTKAFFFTPDGSNTWKYSLEEIVRATPKDAALIFFFGEIDCRPREGIMEQYRKHPDYVLEQEIDHLCTRYVRFIKKAQLRRLGRSYIAGVPAPKRVAIQDLLSGEEEIFIRVIRLFNETLAREAAAQELGFVDLYAVTVAEDGWAREGVHIDHVHLLPSIVGEAIERSLAQ